MLEVHLFTGLVCNNLKLEVFGKSEFQVEVPEGFTLEQLEQFLNLDVPYNLIYFVNGQARAKTWVLQENDRVGMFLPVGGG